ncbi:MAG: exopolyphosphatase [Flavobacteriaceae bacterium]|nr:exopolyphosphatase [Flavobacteriaceae bacterium]
MRIRKFAGIDVGSNAIRLLIHNVVEEGDKVSFKKNALVRVPIRLGQDVFTNAKISPENIDRMKDAFEAFRLIMKVHGVEHFMACATSAMREAQNGETVVDIIREHSGIPIQIIDGKREAEIIASTDLHQLIEKDKSYLYVDVGGGSTELTIFSKGKVKTSQSFKIGTVRLLNNTLAPDIWSAIENWIKSNTQDMPKISVIGSGGNINKLFKLSGRKMGVPLSYIWLNSQYQYLKGLSYAEKVHKLGLNPDRADVIVPATRIYLSAIKWSGSKKIHVPKIGLADGMIKTMYHEM